VTDISVAVLYESLPIAVMTVRRGGALLHATRLGTRWLEECGAFDRAANRIVQTSALGDGLLKLVEECISRSAPVTSLAAEAHIRADPQAGRDTTDVFAHLLDVAVLHATGASVRIAALRQVAEQEFRATRAESIVGALVSEGRTVEAIAQHLTRSKETIRTHLKRLFAKCEVQNQEQLRECLRYASMDLRPPEPRG
jgi:DNA-binding CsgD family transcriptional regulator